jgi:hypothetical protein
MNDRWKKQDGKPWFDAEDRRAHKRFQRHIRTTRNPKGRIRREPCFADAEHTSEAEAHHPDYARPFLVLWVCPSCHRKVDHGSLKFRKTDLWDYSSLINQRPGGQKPCVAPGTKRMLQVARTLRPTGTDDVPF